MISWVDVSVNCVFWSCHSTPHTPRMMGLHPKYLILFLFALLCSVLETGAQTQTYLVTRLVWSSLCTPGCHKLTEMLPMTRSILWTTASVSGFVEREKVWSSYAFALAMLRSALLRVGNLRQGEWVDVKDKIEVAEKMTTFEQENYQRQVKSWSAVCSDIQVCTGDNHSLWKGLVWVDGFQSPNGQLRIYILSLG